MKYKLTLTIRSYDDDVGLSDAVFVERTVEGREPTVDRDLAPMLAILLDDQCREKALTTRWATAEELAQGIGLRDGRVSKSSQ